MTPDEFEAATPRELYWRLEAHQALEHRMLDGLAQLAAWVMNPWLQHKLKSTDLIGPTPPRDQEWPTGGDA